MADTYRIEAIALHEVGVFDDVRIDFPRIESAERDAQKAEIHVFTGPNGCGKSTLLYALAAIFGSSKEYELIKQRFRGAAIAA
jgi:predicted ATPase